ncbi:MULTISPECIES: nucleotide excision repair endonuclease [Planococcus]|uniref:GIY-YIG catalytic domain-containing protein n=1 Tax=Planococcus citreus TaxID=1373 RepID=A0A497YEM5_9BACL|nr:MULTISPECIES: nucleotide excision repair endonuclease [Planococcus]MDN5708477.1 nucleotide excision repair endonuclease [Planococcus sp. (in: firmicutes)]AUD12743.1 nucleotide excision repair endonuclease [Planococcus sp. MB-3u-03]PKG46729.1 nucleotide excision repair endonuclease [Planococcus sp. Urea-trap-24]PKG89574.1 nucleotide excision repair endonuclease [Planococcus sp. Urea-3u-39]PKH36117.1 nucleotide excision repair endonuclease [Planococcus sp. MB-3u-09]
MINIQAPKADITITQRKQEIQGDEAVIKPLYGFIDLHEIPRDKGGIIQFFNHSGELLFVGKARKLRQRVKKHFEDNVSPLKNHRDEVHRIAVSIVEDPMEREIYETYLINTGKAKYNVDKVFYRD